MQQVLGISRAKVLFLSAMDERIKKWRLVLGSPADPEGRAELGEGEEQGMDQVLEALYDSNRHGGLGPSSPNVNRWLGDIRKYFPAPVVQIMQKDALHQLGLKKMLLEPELLQSIEADVSLMATILSLNKVMPERTKATARQVVEKVVKALQDKLRQPMITAIKGSIHRAARHQRPRHNEIDWHHTIRRNLKHYQRELKAIIPQQLVGFGRKGRALRHVILLIDQSGSMASSMVYASVFGAILASLRSVSTRLVVFDTAVVDLSDQLHDPVELLFGTQLGGGTDINKAVAYAEQWIANPSQSILFLISDLFEGGNAQELIKRIASLKAGGTQVISLLALNDEGAPSYDRDVAAALAQLDIPAFACTPEQFPGLMAAVIEKQDIRQWMGRQQIAGKF